MLHEVVCNVPNPSLSGASSNDVRAELPHPVAKSGMRNGTAVLKRRPLKRGKKSVRFPVKCTRPEPKLIQPLQLHPYVAANFHSGPDPSFLECDETSDLEPLLSTHRSVRRLNFS